MYAFALRKFNLPLLRSFFKSTCLVPANPLNNDKLLPRPVGKWAVRHDQENAGGPCVSRVAQAVLGRDTAGRAKWPFGDTTLSQSTWAASSPANPNSSGRMVLYWMKSPVN
jgi:hypothetical protein